MGESNFYTKLVEERNELSKKLEELSEFITSPKYQEISANQKKLLVEQERHMTGYLTVLNLRIKDLA